MKDGYMISVDEDTDDEGDASVFNVAIINGDIWYWDPETDEPMQDFSWGKVKQKTLDGKTRRVRDNNYG